LADRVIVLRNGKIAEITRPATFLHDRDTAERLQVRLDSHHDTSEDQCGAEVEQKPQPRELMAPGTTDEDRTTPADGNRKKADFTIYKYYLANAGYAAMFFYGTAVVVWIFCTESSGKSSTCRTEMVRN
jgi:ABC-type glutathione transport system ATPase component